MKEIDNHFSKVMYLVYIELVKILRDYNVYRLDAFCIAAELFDKYRAMVDESDC